jgi:hypothetical protein
MELRRQNHSITKELHCQQLDRPGKSVAEKILHIDQQEKYLFSSQQSQTSFSTRNTVKSGIVKSKIVTHPHISLQQHMYYHVVSETSLVGNGLIQRGQYLNGFGFILQLRTENLLSAGSSKFKITVANNNGNT